MRVRRRFRRLRRRLRRDNPASRAGTRDGAKVHVIGCAKIVQHPWPLPLGTRLGPYEILAPIGAGGMGEVYRARDTKLDRDVAIKVLPAALAQDPERLARFEREAKVLASLSHPNIAQIYRIEDRALVIDRTQRNISADPSSLDERLSVHPHPKLPAIKQ